MLKKHEIKELQEWAATSNCGCVIKGTHIWPLKAPIGLLFDIAQRQRYLQTHNRWDHVMVAKQAEEMGYAGIFAVVNLCYTTKYMKRWTWPPPTHYLHFPIKGLHSGEIPDMNPACQYLLRHHAEAQSSNKLIVVHCTHGINRTGTLCTAFLRQYFSISHDEALTRFQNARHSCTCPTVLSTVPDDDAPDHQEMCRPSKRKRNSVHAHNVHM